MLVQHPSLPFFAIAGDFYPSSSTPSTQTHQFPLPPNPLPSASVAPTPGVLLGLPLTTTAVATTAVVLNQNVALKSLTTPDRLCRLYTLSQSPPHQQQQATAHQHSLVVVCTTQPTLNSQTMPRQSQSKMNVDQDHSAVRSARPPSVPMVAGGKRDASALSATAPVVVPNNNNNNAPLESGDQTPLRLPPKLKESERMMHVQRWVNHLPWNDGNDGQSGQQTQWHYWYRHIDEDRELTPPPSRTYLSRLPFTPEEQQTMLRFFSPNSDYRNPAAGGAVVPNTYPHLSYHNQRTNALHQAAAAAAANATATNPHFQQQLSATQHQLNPGNANAASGANPELEQCTKKPTVLRRLDAEPVNGSRFFAEWETRLISHLFQDYFPGRPEPMGNAAVALPSLNEVRARIASSRLKETRTAMAVRAKIKRMQSSGTWIEYP